MSKYEYMKLIHKYFNASSLMCSQYYQLYEENKVKVKVKVSLFVT